MLSRNLEKTLHKALALAGERTHEYVTLEHLLLALTHDADAMAVMRACGVDLDKLAHEVTQFINSELQGLIAPGGADPTPTAGFQRVVQRAAIHVQSSAVRRSPEPTSWWRCSPNGKATPCTSCASRT